VTIVFDPDDYELRWPPQLFIDELNRLVGDRSRPTGINLRGGEAASEVEWLLTEAFTSTEPAEALGRIPRSGWGRPGEITAEQWLSELAQEAVTWPEPGSRKPYWTLRTSGVSRQNWMTFEEMTRAFRQLTDEFEMNGYLVHAFGKECVDDDGPRPDPGTVLSRRLGYSVHWPVLQAELAGWTEDQFFDLVEVLHDLVARPSRRWYHNYANCGWHYSGFVTRPGRRLYRWQVNRLLSGTRTGLRLAESGEDLGRLVRVEPTGLEDVPERALEAALPETVDRVRHAIALFRARGAGVEERRSAVIALAGILEERRHLLKAELLSKDEGALFTIANGFAIRHQRADQRGDYDSAFLDWLFWWYLATVELTDQLLARQGRER
jgi:hypothetical protein